MNATVRCADTGVEDPLTYARLLNEEGFVLTLETYVRKEERAETDPNLMPKGPLTSLTSGVKSFFSKQKPFEAYRDDDFY